MGRRRIYKDAAQRTWAWRRRQRISPPRSRLSRDEWQTPHSVFEPLDEEFHFDLDVCAMPHNAMLPRFIPPGQNGLTTPWTGVCWCNPPYSNIKHWLERAVEQTRLGATVVCLVPYRPGAGWWLTWISPFAAEIRNMGRITFTGAADRAPFDSALVAYRPPPDQ